jgi:hypothetical protein
LQVHVTQKDTDRPVCGAAGLQARGKGPSLRVSGKGEVAPEDLRLTHRTMELEMAIEETHRGRYRIE